MRPLPSSGDGCECGLLWGVEPHSIPPARRVVVVPGLWQLRPECSGPAAALGGDKVLSPCVPNKPTGSGSQLWLSGVTRKGRRGACRSSPGMKGLSMPNRCGACRRPWRSACQDLRRESGSYSVRSCTPRSAIGLFDDWPGGGCLSSPCRVAPGFWLSLGRAGLIRVMYARGRTRAGRESG